jgi:hypothetical protein
MNFASCRVDYRCLKVLIVAQAIVTEVLCKRSAMRNRIGIRFEFNSDSISLSGTPSFISKKNICLAFRLLRQSGVSAFVPK